MFYDCKESKCLVLTCVDFFYQNHICFLHLNWNGDKMLMLNLWG